jgi:hypothetical protein
MANKKKNKKANGKEPRVRVSPELPAMNGASRQRTQTLSQMVPVRFDPDVLAEVRRRAIEDDRSVSAWIRRAVDHELRRNGT